MSSGVGKSWYTKYRPRTLEEYSGPQVKSIISKRFQKLEDYPHTIYVRGPRGTGKTTLCRLLSKYYLCENPKEDGTPCEECEMCQSINEGLIDGNGIGVEIPGVQEINATQDSGKSVIQDIIDDAIQAPIYTNFKVVIFDECHMITPQAQNALLKVIEDIPSHLICMFCTTNEEKVLQTIKSRMQLVVDARKQTVSDMADRLEYIAQKEGLKYSREALEIIAKKGSRVPRECINILENVAKSYNKQVTVESLKDGLGGISSEKYIEYFEAANKSLSDVMVFIRGLKDGEVKYKDFISGLIGFVMDSLYIKHGIALEEFPKEYIKTIKKLFEMYDSSDFDVLLQIIEYMSNQAYIDDENKIEMLMVITAMRIGKVNLLANGLANEQKEAIVENKRSLYEHSQSLKRSSELISEKLKIELGMDEISEAFEGTTLIENTGGLLADVEIPELKPVLDADEEKEPEDEDSGNLDDFFS